MASVYPEGASLIPNKDTIHSPVVKMAERKTSSITGFFTCVLGVQLENGILERPCDDLFVAEGASCFCSHKNTSLCNAAEEFSNRPECERGEEA